MNDPLEQKVVSSMEQLLAKYQHLDSLAEQLLGQPTDVSAMDATMIEMKQQRTEIEDLNRSNQSLNERYRASRPHASAHVKSLTQKIGGLMQSLLMKINQLERSTKTTQDNLMPQIHHGVKAVQMKNAYGKHH